MVFEGSNQVIQHVEPVELNGEYAELLSMFDGKVIAIDRKSIALFKSRASISDALGNGLINLVTLPEAHTFDPGSTPWVCERQSGFVGFANGYALLILPRAVRLFPGKKDALHNTRCIVELPLVTS